MKKAWEWTRELVMNGTPFRGRMGSVSWACLLYTSQTALSMAQVACNLNRIIGCLEGFGQLGAIELVFTAHDGSCLLYTSGS